ncbi:hypothetical protein BDZ85DRAFT_278053 [Elsinoe ampelina]|uniref:DUF7730 domain-containing protein n=1 Tax=Elsinoe ampelina TaxID=302913 RepID=A0A6A6GRQ7_9PEZI|nr:hypothetical protein BDZ85DRAFT_278053 [Elsinoe ampelina]
MPKRKRDDDDVPPDDDEVYSSLDGEKSYSKRKNAKSTHTHAITFQSESRFSLTPMVIHEGLFKGYQAILIKPEPERRSSSSFLDLPAEIRNAVYQELFGTVDGKLRIQAHRKEGKLRSYLEVTSEKRHHSTSVIAPIRRTAIFSTCRQLYEEGTSMFFGLNTVVTPNINKLAEFLVVSGSAMVDKIRTIELEAVRSGTFSSQPDAMRLLEEASTRLETVTLLSRNWIGTPKRGHRRTFWRSSGYPPAVLARVLFPVLRALHATRPDISAVVQMIKFNRAGEACDDCSTGIHWRDATHCTIGQTQLTEAIDDFYKEATKELESDDEKREAEQLAKEKIEQEKIAAEQKRDEAMDDYSYLEPVVAVDRANTGRPKRASNKNIRYSE